MLPKIVFRYSSIYDRKWKKLTGTKAKDSSKEYPSEEKIRRFIKRAQEEWKKHEKRILNQISKITGLKWKNKTICCYVVGRCIPFSDPLTIKIFKNLDSFVDTLTHELIHQILIQNSHLKKYERLMNKINSRYKNEPKKTINHILVHSIHKELYLKLFNEKKLERDKKKLSHKYDYRRSWEIVEKEGHKNILNMIKNPNNKK